MPDVSLTVKNCGGFKPYMQLNLFLNEITSILHPLLKSAAGSEAYSRVIESLHYTWENVTMYNQNPVSALENLVRELVKINITGQKIFLEAIA